MFALTLTPPWRLTTSRRSFPVCSSDSMLRCLGLALGGRGDGQPVLGSTGRTLPGCALDGAEDDEVRWFSTSKAIKDAGKINKAVKCLRVSRFLH